MTAASENHNHQAAAAGAPPISGCITAVLAKLNRNHEAQERLLDRLRRNSERRFPGEFRDLGSLEGLAPPAAGMSLEPLAFDHRSRIALGGEKPPSGGGDRSAEPAIWEEIGRLRAQTAELLADLEDQLSALKDRPFSQWLPAIRQGLAVLAEKRRRPIHFSVEGGKTAFPPKAADALVELLAPLLEFLLTQGFEEQPNPSFRTDTDQIRIEVKPYEHLISLEISGGGSSTAGPVSEGGTREPRSHERGKTSQWEGAFWRWIRRAYPNSEDFDRFTAVGGSFRFFPETSGNPFLRIEVPLWDRLVRVVLIGQGSQVFALPLAFIECAKPLETSDRRRIEKESAVFLNEAYVPVFCLNHLLGDAGEPGKLLLVLKQPAGRALTVDRIWGEQRVLIRDLGPHLNRVPGLAGAVVLAVDRLVPLLDLGALLRGGHDEEQP